MCSAVPFTIHPYAMGSGWGSKMGIPVVKRDL